MPRNFDAPDECSTELIAMGERYVNDAGIVLLSFAMMYPKWINKYIEYNEPKKEDSILQRHFEEYPQLSKFGVHLIQPSQRERVRNDIIIHLDKEKPSTFDILMIYTSVVESRMSKLITRPALREILAAAPSGSELALERIDYKTLVNISNVQPNDLTEAFAYRVHGKAKQWFTP
jgi:hypothetical protein